jgi:prepilin-type N-terminal cleavage/methylation domain-containing protein
MTPLARIRRRLGQQRGFTLIELLVSMTVGVVLVGVAFGLLDAVVRTFGSSGERVDVSQRGRQAVDTITQKLRSQVCGGGPTTADPAAEYTPIFTYADKNRVVFWSDVGDKAANGITPLGKRLRGLELSSNTISELEFPGSGQNPSAIPSKRDLVTDVAANNGSGSAKGLFRFYAYNPAAADQTANAPLYLELTGAPLAAADLKRIVRVTVAFTAFPHKGQATDSVAADFNGDFLSRTAASPYEFTEPPTDPTVVEPRCK